MQNLIGYPFTWWFVKCALCILNHLGYSITYAAAALALSVMNIEYHLGDSIAYASVGWPLWRSHTTTEPLAGGRASICGK